MWVRGLKHETLHICIKELIVASYVGAWIETFSHLRWSNTQAVASYVGAWIETVDYVDNFVTMIRRILCGCVD